MYSKRINSKKNFIVYIFLLIPLVLLGFGLTGFDIIKNRLDINKSKASSVNAGLYQNGGTDLIVYDLGDFATNKSQELLWRSDSEKGGIKTLIGSYDKNPTAVRKLISDVCNDNQKKIGLTLWFAPFPDGMEQNAAYGWMINSKGGKLTSRHENNINQLLELIINQKDTNGTNCFNEIQFRFAPMASATPMGWDKWEEDIYKENYSFILYTKNVVDKKILGSNIKVVFDLGAELGGLSIKQADPYVERIWKDYTSNFGTKDSYGFSIAYGEGRIKTLFEIYDKVGKRPNNIALDLYPLSEDDWDTILKKASAEIKNANAELLPVIVQETFSVNNKSKIYSIAQSNNILLQTVMQWQVVRDNFNLPNGGQNAFSGTFYKYNYDFEIAKPIPTATQSIQVPFNPENRGRLITSVPSSPENRNNLIEPKNNLIEPKINFSTDNSCNSFEECSKNCKLGDIDCNGEINIQDISTFTSSLKNNPNTKDPNLSQREYLSDMNNDGEVNINDFIIFKDQYIKEYSRKD